MSADSTSKVERIHGLDAYRGVLMMLGIYLHAVLPFFGEFDQASEATQWIIYTPFMAIRHFRMPAFFMLSGFFTALLWVHRGPRQTLRNRYDRITVPLLAMMIVIPPAAVFIGGLFEGDVSHALSEVVEHALPIHHFHHLWFLYYLIWTVLITAGLDYFMQRRGITWPKASAWLRETFESPWRFVFALGGLHFIGFMLLEWQEGPTGAQWLPDVLPLLYYLLFFIVGWALYVIRPNLSTVIHRAWTLVLLGLICTIAYIIVRDALGGFDGKPKGPDDSWESFGYWIVMQATSSVALFAYTRGLMGVFMRHVSGESYFWRYISDASYFVYIFHMFPCLGLPDSWGAWEAPLLLRFSANVVLSLIICFVAYDLIGRSTWIGHFLNGRRYPRGPRRVRYVGIFLTIIGMGAVLGSGHYHEKQVETWIAQGGPATLLPFGIDFAPYGVPHTEAKESKIELCIPADNYAVCVGGVWFEKAEEGCKALGGRLVILETRKEFKEVGDLVQDHTHESYWLGLTDRDTEGRFLWLDGSPVAFSAWNPGEPNDYGSGEDCTHAFDGGDGHWNDLRCGAHLPYVCEFENQPRSADCQHALDALAEVDSQDEDERAPWVEKVELACAAALTAPDQPEPVHTLEPSSPSGLEGVWSMDLEKLKSAPKLQDIPSLYRNAALTMLEGVKLRVLFAEQEIVVTMNLLGKQKTERLPYRILEKSENTRTLEVRENERSIHVLTFDGDKLRILHEDQWVHLTRAGT